MAYEHQHHVFTQTEHFFLRLNESTKISNMNMTERRDICKRDYLFSFYWAINWRKKNINKVDHICGFCCCFGLRLSKIQNIKLNKSNCLQLFTKQQTLCWSVISKRQKVKFYSYFIFLLWCVFFSSFFFMLSNTSHSQRDWFICTTQCN